MPLRQKFEAWMIRKEFNQDTFQSFVCWMLLAGTVASLFTPAWLVIFQNTSNHCEDGTFTILAHYRIHSWLYEMFEDFKEYERITNGKSNDKVCFELIVSDSEFDKKVKPSIWIPENYVWLEEAEDDNDIYGSNIVSDIDNQCTDLTNIPMGFITWKQFGDQIDNPMDYVDFLLLAKARFNEEDAGSLSFTHSHPNITSSGVLGMMLGYQTQINSTIPFVYTDYTTDEIATFNEPIKVIEGSIHELGPNELIGITTLLGHGPEYIQAMYGFESDVAYNMHLYKDVVTALWSDTLSFTYFTYSYWMSHPVCILDDFINKRVDASKKMTDIADRFVKFIFNETRVEELLNYGIRPAPNTTEESSILNSSVLSTENGVNPSISTSFANSLDFPSWQTIQDLRYQWQFLKEPVYLRILLDKSDEMNEPISTRSERTRWSRAINGLDYFAKYLEDDAIIELSCFSRRINPCGSSDPSPNTTLIEQRGELADYMRKGMITTQDEKIHLYDAVNETYTDLTNIKNDNDNNGRNFNYVLLVVSEDDTGRGDDRNGNNLIENIGINYRPSDIHIFTISFWGKTGGESADVLKSIASNTNGKFWQTKEGLQDIYEEIAHFF